MENQRENQKGRGHLAKKEKEKKSSRLTGFQKFLVVLAVLLAIALIAVVAMKSVFIKPELGGNRPDSQQEEEQIDWGDGVRPKGDGQRKSEDFYTILLLGRDTGGGGNTDTILLASYDVTNQKAAVMSIPRDTMVNVSWDVKKINSVYNMNGGGDKGIKALYKEISQLVGFEPDYQVVVEWEAVGAIVDAIGGVYFDNPYPMDYHDPTQDLVIEQAPGYRLLTGEDAMQVIRWRKNDKDSPYGYRNGIGDAGRMELQQDFLKAVLEQLMKPSNVMNIGKIAKVFQDNVETDLSFQNILWFGQQAIKGGLTPDSVEFLTMPYRDAYCWSRSYQMNLAYLVPDATKLLDVVNNHLSPFVEQFTLGDLDIMSVNKDGSISSTTGHVEDAKAAVPPVKPAVPQEIDPENLPEGLEPGDIIVVDPNAPIDPNAPVDPNAPAVPQPESPEPSMPELPAEPAAPSEKPAEKPKPTPKPEPKPEPTPDPKPQPEPVPQPEPQPEPPAPEPPADGGFVIIPAE